MEKHCTTVYFLLKKTRKDKNGDSPIDAWIAVNGERTSSIIEFRRCLGDYVHEIGSDKPIVFIVDELDRCNPHFAVKTLERIKHLFNLPGILFVLSIDKNQLCNSIRGYFGSEQFNAEEYLQRFVDFEYQLPQPSIKEYCEYLWGEYDFDQFTEFEKGRRGGY